MLLAGGGFHTVIYFRLSCVIIILYLHLIFHCAYHVYSIADILISFDE